MLRCRYVKRYGTSVYLRYFTGGAPGFSLDSGGLIGNAAIACKQVMLLHYRGTILFLLFGYFSVKI